MIPAVVNSPERMLKVKLLAVKDDSEKAVKSLHKAGILHIETSHELSPPDIEALEKERDNVNRLLASVTDALNNLPEDQRVSPREDIEVIYTRPLRELDEETTSLCHRLDVLYRRTLAPTERLDHLDHLHRYLGPLSQQSDLHVDDLNFSGRYLFSRVFVMASDIYWAYQDRIKEHLLETVVRNVEEKAIVYGVGRIEDLEPLRSIILGAEGIFLDIPDEHVSLREFAGDTEKQISELRRELTGLYQELIAETLANQDRLTLLRDVLEAESQRLAVLDKACEARYVVLIEGWVPESNIEPAISEIKDEVVNVYIDIREPEADEEPPTRMKNKGGFKPFQVIVNLFGTPRYREWDPTPIIAYSFAIFFGLMVGDVIYSLGVMALARFLLPKFVEDPQDESVKLLQRLIYISGVVALVLGLLTGQYMGDFHHLFGIGDIALSQTVKHMMQDPVTFIVLSLAIGFVHVNIAHALALVKGVRERKPLAVVNKAGLFVLQLGVPSLLNSLLNVNIPGFTPALYSVLSYIMMAGVLIIIVTTIMQNGGLGAILWLFDVTGLLGDVMSYARLAGVGLATFYLASTFNLLSVLFRDMLPGATGAVIGSIIGIFIIIFGHLVNVVLTAITGFIHSLRLCFVEFLFKFYEGGGTQYSPFRLRKKAAA